MSNQNQNGTSKNLPARRPPMAIDPHRAMVIVTKDGKKARMVTRTVRLSEADGTLINAPGMGRIVAAEGYKVVASAAGMMLFRPEQVIVNDRMQPNGYTDPDTGDMFCRAVCIGYTPEGQITSTDRTIVFNHEAKKKLDLLTKAKNNPDICKLVPKGSEAPSTSGTWARYSIDEAIDVLIDTSTQEAIKWAIEAGKSREFGPRKGQTMAERNAIKAHPGIRIPNLKDLRGVEEIPVTAWYTSEGPLRIDASVLEIDVTKLLDAGTHDAKTIDIEALDQEDIAGSQDVDETPPAADAEPSAPEPPEQTAERREMEAQAEFIGVEFDPAISDEDLRALLDTNQDAEEDEESRKKLISKIAVAAVHKKRSYTAYCKTAGIDANDLESASTAILEDILQKLQAVGD